MIYESLIHERVVSQTLSNKNLTLAIFRTEITLKQFEKKFHWNDTPRNASHKITWRWLRFAED